LIGRPTNIKNKITNNTTEIIIILFNIKAPLT